MTDFAMGGTARTEICNLMVDIVLLPGTLLHADVMNMIKPPLFLTMDDDLGDEQVSLKCVNALKFGIGNFPELFTE